MMASLLYARSGMSKMFRQRFKHRKCARVGPDSLEQAKDVVQEAAGCQNKLHGLQAHGVALGWQVHGCGAHAHGDAVALVQLSL